VPSGDSQRGKSVPKRGKSRLASGQTLLPTASGCSPWARLTKDILRALVGHCGGADTISETQKLAARRVSVLEAELVFLEDGFALAREHGGEPEPHVLDLYGRLADRQRRLSEPLGWRRAQREVTSWRDRLQVEAAEYLDSQATDLLVEAETLTGDAAAADDTPSESES
jgi:hypothetical protein